jgi:hypothetical protein
VRPGDRVVVLATEQRGMIDHVTVEGKIAVELDREWGEGIVREFDPHQVETCWIADEGCC